MWTTTWVAGMLPTPFLVCGMVSSPRAPYLQSASPASPASVTHSASKFLGLQYLHHDCKLLIFHWDFKFTSILLDLDYEVHLGDFDISKVVQTVTYPQMLALRATLLQSMLSVREWMRKATSKAWCW